MAVYRSGGTSALLAGAGAWPPRPPNCVSSGVHVSVKSYFPASPVRSTTGRSSTEVCIRPVKSAMVAFLTFNTPSPLKNKPGRPFGSPSLLVSFDPVFPTASAYTVRSFVSRWKVSLKRSASSFCIIARNCLTLGCPSMSGFARISNLSDSSQAGPPVNWRG